MLSPPVSTSSHAPKAPTRLPLRFPHRLLRHFLAPLILLLLAGLMIAQSSRGQSLTRWDQMLDRSGAGHTRYAAILPALPGPEGMQAGTAGGMGATEGFERDADAVLPPAGLTQLFVAGAALEKLGPEFRFETRIEWRRPVAGAPGKVSDLTIVGSGDPSWGMPEWNETPITRFEQIAQILHDQGVQEIHGGIRFAAAGRAWDEVGPRIGWLEQDLVTCEGAYPHAVNVSLNCATYVVEDPSESYWSDPAIDLPVKLDLDYGSKTVLRPELDGEGFRIRGTWADNTPATEIRLPIRHPREWAERLLEAALESRGIRIVNRSALSSAPGRFALIDHSATIHSPPLRELLKPMLKDGAGLIAESLFVTLGGPSGIRQYLDAQLPAERTLSIWDGSGLSRSNTASAREVYALLQALARSPHFGRIWDALSVAGLDGTLANRMTGTPAEGILRAKTGAIPGHYPIAGYVPRFDGGGRVSEVLPFVVLSESQAPSSRAATRAARAARSTEDRLGAELVRAMNF